MLHGFFQVFRFCGGCFFVFFLFFLFFPKGLYIIVFLNVPSYCLVLIMWGVVFIEYCLYCIKTGGGIEYFYFFQCELFFYYLWLSFSMCKVVMFVHFTLEIVL